MELEIQRQKQRLDALFSKISEIGDDELKSHWAKYLCVLVSGFIENALKILLMKYVSTRSHPNVSRFISNRLKNITNLNDDKIRALIGDFSEEWRDLLEKSITNDQKDSCSPSAIIGQLNPKTSLQSTAC